MYFRYFYSVEIRYLSTPYGKVKLVLRPSKPPGNRGKLIPVPSCLVRFQIPDTFDFENNNSKELGITTFEVL